MSIGQGAPKLLKAQEVKELDALDGAGLLFSEKSHGSEVAEIDVLTCDTACHQEHD